MPENEFFDEETFLKREKRKLQRDFEKSLKVQEVLETPDFLIDSSKSEERKAVYEKIQQLLKRRFSLIKIADVLQTNNYAELDDIINSKERLYKLVEKYTSEETPETIRLFSGFKITVGDENARTYSEQERRMKAAISIIYNGSYFKDVDSQDEIAKKVEDIISSVIDSPDFSTACQIEAEFIRYELEKTIKALSDVKERKELQELVEELRNISGLVEERSHAYDLMNRLISNSDTTRQVIENPNSDEGRG